MVITCRYGRHLQWIFFFRNAWNFIFHAMVISISIDFTIWLLRMVMVKYFYFVWPWKLSIWDSFLMVEFFFFSWHNVFVMGDHFTLHVVHIRDIFELNDHCVVMSKFLIEAFELIVYTFSLLHHNQLHLLLSFMSSSRDCSLKHSGHAMKIHAFSIGGSFLQLHLSLLHPF